MTSRWSWMWCLHFCHPRQENHKVWGQFGLYNQRQFLERQRNTERLKEKEKERQKNRHRNRNKEDQTCVYILITSALEEIGDGGRGKRTKHLRSSSTSSWTGNQVGIHETLYKTKQGKTEAFIWLPDTRSIQTLGWTLGYICDPSYLGDSVKRTASLGPAWATEPVQGYPRHPREIRCQTKNIK